MQVTLLDAGRIEAEWPVIAERLWPALSVDPNYDVEDLKKRALAGSSLIFEVTEGAEGLWVITLRDNGELVAWTTAIAGKVHGGPKQRTASLRSAVAVLEQVLKTAGVKAHRICGRDWSRIFPDYGPFDGDEYGLEKRLG
jgi:hypothetical protein